MSHSETSNTLLGVLHRFASFLAEFVGRRDICQHVMHHNSLQFHSHSPSFTLPPQLQVKSPTVTYKYLGSVLLWQHCYCPSTTLSSTSHLTFQQAAAICTILAQHYLSLTLRKCRARTISTILLLHLSTPTMNATSSTSGWVMKMVNSPSPSLSTRKALQWIFLPSYLVSIQSRNPQRNQ